MQDVIYQIEDLISTIDQRLAKLKLALALREQFNDLVSDITMFTTKYTEIVREVERPGYSAQDKIKKYEEVSLHGYEAVICFYFLNVPVLVVENLCGSLQYLILLQKLSCLNWELFYF